MAEPTDDSIQVLKNESDEKSGFSTEVECDESADVNYVNVIVPGNLREQFSYKKRKNEIEV